MDMITRPFEGGPPSSDKEVPEGVEKTCLKILERAKLQLLRNRFFGSLMLSMKFKSVPGLGTYATDGTYIFYDPFTVVEEKLVSLAVASIAHEVLHKIFLHPYRRSLRTGSKFEKEKWNIACDLAINPILKDEGFNVKPDLFIYNPKYHGWSAERIYDDLKAEDVPDDVKMHLVIPQSNNSQNQPITDGEIDEIKEKIRGQVINAALVNEAYGLQSNTLKDMVAGLKKNQVDWKAKMYKTIIGTLPTDYSMARPNRRYLYADLYLPSIERKGVGNVYIWPDSSGSISNKEAEAISAEMRYILEVVQPAKTIIVHCDAKVHGVSEFGQGECPSGFEFIGKGGTDPKPFFEYVNNQQDAHIAVCLTDMAFDHNIPQPSYPVIWVSTSPR